LVVTAPDLLDGGIAAAMGGILGSVLIVGCAV
jgi:hypothetical protein